MMLQCSNPGEGDGVSACLEGQRQRQQRRLNCVFIPNAKDGFRGALYFHCSSTHAWCFTPLAGASNSTLPVSNFAVSRLLHCYALSIDTKRIMGCVNYCHITSHTYTIVEYMVAGQGSGDES
jgi:hypothetical protein